MESAFVTAGFSNISAMFLQKERLGLKKYKSFFAGLGVGVAVAAVVVAGAAERIGVIVGTGVTSATFTNGEYVETGRMGDMGVVCAIWAAHE